MELDDLRRQWQQPEPVIPATLTAAQIGALLIRQRIGGIEKMRRNARWEMALMVVVAVFTVGFLPYVPELGLLPYVMLLLALGLLYYYYQILGVLRQMTEITSSVHTHLARLCTGLRKLLRFNYYLTWATVPVTLLLITGLPIGRELVRISQRAAHKQPFQWGHLPLLLGIVLTTAWLMKVLLLPVTRWYLQRLYGQHLDRLEGQLRELENSELPGSPGSASHFTG